MSFENLNFFIFDIIFMGAKKERTLKNLCIGMFERWIQ